MGYASLVNILDVGCSPPRKNAFDSEVRYWFAQILKEAAPAPEQHGSQRDLQFIDSVQVQELLHYIGAAGDSYVCAACRLAGQLERTLRSITGEVERRPTRAPRARASDW